MIKIKFPCFPFPVRSSIVSFAVRFCGLEILSANMSISEDLEANKENYGNIQCTGKVYTAGDLHHFQIKRSK